MQRVLLTIALLLAFAVTTWSQDAATQTDTDEADVATVEDVEPEEDEVEPEKEEIDETGLDDESYADIEDDDFRPSEDIPADQSIPFPTDI